MRDVRVVISLVLALGLALALLFLWGVVPEPEPVVEPVGQQPTVASVSKAPGPPRQPARKPVRRRLRAAQPAVVAAEPPVPIAPLALAETPPPAVVVPEPVAAPEPLPPPPEMPQAEPQKDVEGPRIENAAKDGNGEDIARAIAAAKRAAVRTCFEHELKDQPKLTGTVVVELDLAPPNRIEGLRVSDDLNRPTFTSCVTSAMQGVRFAALDEEISVRVPYVLSPERK